MTARVINIANEEKMRIIEKRRNKIEQLFQVKLTFTFDDIDAVNLRVVIMGCRIDCQNAKMYIESLVESNNPKSALVILNSFITDSMIENVEKQSVAVIYKERGNGCLHTIKGKRNQVTLALDLLEEMSKEQANSSHKNKISRRLSASLQNSIVKSSRKVSNCVNASEKVKRAILGGLDAIESKRGEEKSNNDVVQDVILISDSEDEEVFQDVAEEGEIQDEENDISVMIIDSPESKCDTEITTGNRVNSDMICKLSWEFQNMESPSGADKAIRKIPAQNSLHEKHREDNANTCTEKDGFNTREPCNKVSNEKSSSIISATSSGNVFVTRQPISFKIKPLTVRSLTSNFKTQEQSQTIQTNPGFRGGDSSTSDTPNKIENASEFERKIKKVKKSRERDTSKDKRKTRESKLEIPKEIEKDKLKKNKSKKRKSDEKEKERKKSKREICVASDPEIGEEEESRAKKARRLRDLENKREKILKEKHKHIHKDVGKSKRLALRKPSVSEKLRYIVIDGSNVAMSHGKNGVFSCKGLRMCVEFFKKRGHKLITIFLPMWRKCRPRDPSSMRDRYILDDLEDEGYLVYTPSRQIGRRLVASYDDRFILELADRESGVVVSNDQYRDLMYEKSSWTKLIQERLLPYLFVNDHFMVPDDPLGKHGPNLDIFLRNTFYDKNAAAKFQDEFKTLNALYDNVDTSTEPICMYSKHPLDRM